MNTPTTSVCLVEQTEIGNEVKLHQILTSIVSIYSYVIFLSKYVKNTKINLKIKGPCLASSFSLQLQRHAKFDVAEPIHCRIIAFLLLIHYFTQ